MTRWLGLAVLVAVLDQLTKFGMTHLLAYGESMEITPFFNLVMVHNRGAAFSFLSGASGWQRELFIGIAIVASAWVFYLLRKYPGQTLFCLALSLILGGAIGNLVDRILVGAVVDFLDFHAMGWHWPAFNVADSGITCGAALLIWESLRGQPSAGTGKQSPRS